VQRVDGKALSENEILFEEYLSLEFDEKNQNTFRQLVIQRCKTVSKKGGEASTSSEKRVYDDLSEWRENDRR
jgi:hypothetical protein